VTLPSNQTQDYCGKGIRHLLASLGYWRLPFVLVKVLGKSTYLGTPEPCLFCNQQNITMHNAFKAIVGSALIFGLASTYFIGFDRIPAICPLSVTSVMTL
uniref:Uncharacterized protein n=1 Tax=Glossina palpalis gambiensis TaxID=67801 RepID=A0A1B0B9J1_9MUSC